MDTTQINKLNNLYTTLREDMGLSNGAINGFILSVLTYADDILQQPTYRELKPFAQILNKTHIGHRVMNIISDDVLLRGTYILDDIIYDDFGNIKEYLLHNNLRIITNIPIPKRIADPLDGWICLDDIGG